MVNFQNELATQLVIVDNAGNRVIVIGPGPVMTIRGPSGIIFFDASGSLPTQYFLNSNSSKFAYINLGDSDPAHANIGINNGDYPGVQYATLTERARLFLKQPSALSHLGTTRSDTQAIVGGNILWNDQLITMEYDNATGQVLSRIEVVNTAAPGNTDAAAIFIQGGGPSAVALSGPVLSLQGNVILMQNAANTRNLVQDTDGFWKVQNEGWTGVTFANGWSGTCQFRLMADGTVRLRGSVVPGTRTGGTTVFTLPVGYRPAVSDEFMIPWTGGAFWNKLDMNTNGTATYFDGTAGGAVGTTSSISFDTV